MSKTINFSKYCEHPYKTCILGPRLEVGYWGRDRNAVKYLSNDRPPKVVGYASISRSRHASTNIPKCEIFQMLHVNCGSIKVHLPAILRPGRATITLRPPSGLPFCPLSLSKGPTLGPNRPYGHENRDLVELLYII